MQPIVYEDNQRCIALTKTIQKREGNKTPRYEIPFREGLGDDHSNHFAVQADQHYDR